MNEQNETTIDTYQRELLRQERLERLIQIGERKVKKALERKEVVRQELLICDLKPTISPIHEEHRGFRLIFVIPNKARYCRLSGEYKTSFHKKYQRYWDGYFNEGNQFTIERFVLFLKEHNLDIDRIVGDSEEMQGIIEYARRKYKKL